MIKEEKFQKNSEVLKEYWVSEIDDTIKNIKRSLDHFFSGIWGWMLNPFVKFAYKFFLSPDVRKKSIAQLDPILDGARLLNSNNLDEVIENYFEDFKKNDLATLRCRKKHEKYPELLENMRKNYIARVKGAKILINSNGESYSELVRNAFSNKEEARNIMIKTLHLAKEGLDFVVENEMMKLSSLIKSQTIRILYEEFNYKENYFKEQIERIYSGENF